jgi:hypothetical protein
MKGDKLKILLKTILQKRGINLSQVVSFSEAYNLEGRAYYYKVGFRKADSDFEFVTEVYFSELFSRLFELVELALIKN